MDEHNGLVSFNGDDTPRADSRKIADQLDIEHESFYRMIKQYEEEVSKDFGLIRFEIGAVKTAESRGTKHTKYALLTEDQCYVFLAYSQNTEQARRCKRLLVKAFAEARAELLEATPALPALAEPANSFRYELRLVVTNTEQMKRAELLIAQAKQLQKTIDMPDGEESRLRTDILRYVKDLSQRFQPPTIRDLARYILYADKLTIEMEVQTLVSQRLLIAEKTAHATKYRLA